MKRFVLGAVVGLALAGGVAWATIPGNDGVIHGCYSANGSLRVIDPSAGTACKNSETAIQWNQQGPTGPPGPAGQQGPPGPAGDGVAGFAYVRFDGLVTRAKGVNSVQASTFAPGLYIVHFSRDVTTCVASATLGADDVLPDGSVSLLISKPGGALAPDVLQVFTRTGPGGPLAPKSFFVELFC